MNGVSGETIVTAAVVDMGVSVIRALWYRTAFRVFVFIVFVVPLDESNAETCVAEYMT